MGGLAGRSRDTRGRHIQGEALAEVPDEVTVQVHGPVATIIIGIEPHLTAVSSACPLLQVAVEPAAANGLVAGGLGVTGVSVVLGVVL